jgi:hypothetical protein
MQVMSKAIELFTGDSGENLLRIDCTGINARNGIPTIRVGHHLQDKADLFLDTYLTDSKVLELKKDIDNFIRLKNIVEV